MYFKTKKDSETGKKFQEIVEKKENAFIAQLEFAEKHGFKSWRQAYWAVFGGISSCCDFIKEPDGKIWGKSEAKNEFFPKKNTKEGKKIYEEIEKLPQVSIREINNCVGFKEKMSKTIGFAWTNDEYYGFVVGDNWDFIVPEDCEEITLSEYKKLFQNPTRLKTV